MYDVRTCRIAVIILYIWLLCGSLITFAYRSTLLASLVSVEKEKPRDTFQSLLDSKMTLLLTRGLLTTALMRDSPRDTLRHVTYTYQYAASLNICDV